MSSIFLEFLIIFSHFVRVKVADRWLTLWRNHTFLWRAEARKCKNVNAVLKAVEILAFFLDKIVEHRILIPLFEKNR